MKATRMVLKASVLAVALMMVGCASTQSNPALGKLTSATHSVSERVLDAQLEREIQAKLATIPEITNKQARVMADVFRGHVLLTGEVPSTQVEAKIVETIKSVPNFQGGSNYLTVALPKLATHTLHEKYLKAKALRTIKAAGVDTKQAKVVVRDDVVYLMGEPNQQRDLAVISTLNQMGGIRDYKVVGVVSRQAQPATQATAANPYGQPTAQNPAYQPNSTVYPPVGQPTYPQTGQPTYPYTPSTPTYPNAQPTPQGQSNPHAPSYLYIAPKPPQSDYVKKWKNPRWAP